MYVFSKYHLPIASPQNFSIKRFRKLKSMLRNAASMSKSVPQVRLELTTSAWLIVAGPCSTRGDTAYKYGALTDCATGATTPESRQQIHKPGLPFLGQRPTFWEIGEFVRSSRTNNGVCIAHMAFADRNSKYGNMSKFMIDIINSNITFI